MKKSLIIVSTKSCDNCGWGCGYDDGMDGIQCLNEKAEQEYNLNTTLSEKTLCEYHEESVEGCADCREELDSRSVVFSVKNDNKNNTKLICSACLVEHILDNYKKGDTITVKIFKEY